MTIAELFIKIGFAGDKESEKKLKGIDTSMNKIKDTSFAAKAALFGIVFGLERVSEMAATAGSDLEKFGAATGLSTEGLQQLQHVAKKYDVTAGEISSTIANLQKLQTEFNVTGTMPATAGLLGIDLSKGDAMDLFERLVSVAKRLRPEQAAFALAPFGISSNVLQLMRRTNLELDKMGAHISSQRELRGLVAVKTGYAQFWEQLQNINMEMTATFGPRIIGTIQHALSAFKTVMVAISDINKAFGGMKYIVGGLAVAIGLAFAPLTTVAGALILVMADYDKFKKGQPSVMGDLQKWVEKPREESEGMSGVRNAFRTAIGMPLIQRPALAGAAAGAGSTGATTEVNQYFDVGRDEAPAASVDALEDAVQRATYQRSGVRRKY